MLGVLVRWRNCILWNDNMTGKLCSYFLVPVVRGAMPPVSTRHSEAAERPGPGPGPEHGLPASPGHCESPTRPDYLMLDNQWHSSIDSAIEDEQGCLAFHHRGLNLLFWTLAGRIFFKTNLCQLLTGCMPFNLVRQLEMNFAVKIILTSCKLYTYCQQCSGNYLKDQNGDSRTRSVHW